jgi:hypothetical protein
MVHQALLVPVDLAVVDIQATNKLLRRVRIRNFGSGSGQSMQTDLAL